MTQTKPTVKLTYSDYCKTPDDERWELIDGELIMAPSPTTIHQAVLLSLCTQLYRFVSERGLGNVFISPIDVVLSDVTVVQPDLLFVSNGRMRIVSERNIRGAPDLVVEVLSPSTARRDWRVKMDLYAEQGAEEYWVVDPDGQRIWVMGRTDEGLVEVGNYGAADTLISPLLPGFAASLAEVFRSSLITGQGE